MRTKAFAFAGFLVVVAVGGAAWAFSGPAPSDTPVSVQSTGTESAGCCVTGDCCCPGQGSCCDLSKRASVDAAKNLKKAASCCSTGNCCCPGAGSCCASTEAAAPDKDCCPSPAKKSCCSK